ncbi:hypothetical protein NEUTE1DRAFT_77832 [Neurospora tetrasperma FGSC 2508]|uniref:TATA-binding protein interacting (TIP20) domain-containing protein n=1 Tax=Neurospora tetrasperma (strain FGSC 2508 / ATCC MYA-4615 / P0657) TaxID=510951 RepID=F8MEX0_NEUT8|nr:uncharacterized protein NEUTE1DRAFT_77832 [Neurospora tetrasperma FGSC 2508]EGO61691.1 hypothetical protein NEUTE1DRAFT_77832 [Neurospora tetrasperma FGSC 2508]EGZ74255.1 TIP120-domain-containing protein [Neurospora tetrasperma FGSC 2509]
MATTVPTNPTSHTVSLLLTKISDADPDFRYMALNDLLATFNVAKPDILQHDFNTSNRTLDEVIKALSDQNGEVQNQAIKVLGPLVKKLPSPLYSTALQKLIELQSHNSDVNSVPAMALKAVVEALPRPVPGVALTKEAQEAYDSVNKLLIPRFLGQTAGKQVPGLLQGAQVTSDSVDVLIEVVRCFGPVLTLVEIEALHDAVLNLLAQEKCASVVKKRAVAAVSMLAHYLSDDLLAAFVKRTVALLRKSSMPPATRRLYITILGSMARSIPHRFGRYLPEVVSFALDALNEEELQAQLEAIQEGSETTSEWSDVREAALVALDAFLSSCPNQMRPYTNDAIEACLRYLKFDPNYAADEDEEMEEEGEEDADFDDDDEFEADGNFDDDDDASWKVRRCAAKALHTIISTRSSGDLLESGVLYQKVAPALVKRFDEREENVRLEVLSAVSLLIRKTGEGVIPDFTIDDATGDSLGQAPQSRKRRRQSSAAGQAGMPVNLSGTGLTSPKAEKIPASGPRADLAALTPAIVKSATRLLKGKLIPTKQATISILDDLISVQKGGLAPYLDQITDLILDAIKVTGSSTSSAPVSFAGGSASATTNTLRIAALRLISSFARNHSSNDLQPYLPKIVDGVVSVVHDRVYKIAAEAVQTAEEVSKAITPPRARMTAQKYKGELQKLYSVIVDRTTDNDADAEVRQKAIHALGTLLSRTSGTEGATLLSDVDRKTALGHLKERLFNETTRLAAVRAIDTIAAFSSSEISFDAPWTQEVVVELAAQLRKANRSLRGSSVMALKHLVLSPATKNTLDDATVQKVVTALVTVITHYDAQLLGPGLLVLARLAQEKPQIVIIEELMTALCKLLMESTVTGTVLDSLLVLVNSIGQTGQGEVLMQRLLNEVALSGDPSVVGKVIGTLLVASGNKGTYTAELFVQEIQKQKGERASLALTILGEAGLRLGDKFPYSPSLFLEQFHSEYDKTSLSAAVALGRAGAGNVAAYVPVILQSMQQGGNTQYLLLQSIKEVLQQVAMSSTDLGELSTPIWNQILAASGSEDNKAVCAECIGRLVIIDPKTYMSKLVSLLNDPSPLLRAIAIQALRYTLADENEVFDSMLKSHLVDMLKTMLEDPEMENRRHAMSTLNSAAHNKADVILGHLNKLMPYVMKETVIKPELIREVQMGPFKHIIDDGLELRKAAYETLYALMETAFSRISIIDLYDRIVAGLSDDNDIKALCNLMVSKLAYIDPEETIRRLDSIAEAFRKTLSTKLKDTAVKQELEKQAEANRAALRVTLLLGEKLKAFLSAGGAVGAAVPGGSAAVAGTNQVWHSYWEWASKEYKTQLQILRDEDSKGAGVI